jgi:hypothetical protein
MMKNRPGPSSDRNFPRRSTTAFVHGSATRIAEETIDAHNIVTTIVAAAPRVEPCRCNGRATTAPMARITRKTNPGKELLDFISILLRPAKPVRQMLESA